MKRKVKFLIGLVIVLALTVFLVVQVSAAKPMWKHEFLEMFEGGNEHMGWGTAKDAPPPIHYNCRPYVVIPGCNNDIPGKECFNGFVQDTFDLGVGCGVIVYWQDDQYMPDYMLTYEINWEETQDPKSGYWGAIGYRQGFTYNGIADMRGYLSSILFSSPFAQWLPMITWRDGIRVPVRVDFTYDPETMTCQEYYGIPCGYVNPNQP